MYSSSVFWQKLRIMNLLLLEIMRHCLCRKVTSRVTSGRHLKIRLAYSLFTPVLSFLLFYSYICMLLLYCIDYMLVCAALLA